MPRATIDDVAARAGVSIKTVSRVVNREINVRAATRAKVEKAIAELNYRPNLSARNLASQRARVIVLVYEDPASFENPSGGFVIRMQTGALAACATADYRLVIYPCDLRRANVVAELGAMLEFTRPAGLVLAAPLSNMPQFVRAINAAGTPLVKLAPGNGAGTGYSVGTNDREISAQLTRHLAAQGHRKIAFVRGHPNHAAVANRYLGYLDGLEQSGLQSAQRLVENGDNSFESGEAAGHRLLTLADPPTAIFTANDDMAAGVIRAAALRGIAVPGRLSVAGFDDTSLARQLCPTLTTIRQPLPRMVERATLVLIGNGPEEPPLQGTEIVPATIEIRESTGPAPGDAGLAAPRSQGRPE